MAESQGKSSAVVWGVAAAVVLLMSCGRACAATYEVGDNAGWTIPSTSNGVDYTTWADSKTFRVNDILHFTYANGAHNVQPLPTADSYTSCDLTAADASLLQTGGDNSITLTTAGPAYFVCEIPGHCGLGMKFQINVLAATAGPSSSPSGSPVSSPRPLGPAPGPLSQESSAPLSILVSGSLAVVVLASTMLLSSF